MFSSYRKIYGQIADKPANQWNNYTKFYVSYIKITV